MEMTVQTRDGSRINQVMTEVPGAFQIFKECGIDTRREGQLTIMEAATKHGVDAFSLVFELRREAKLLAKVESELERNF